VKTGIGIRRPEIITISLKRRKNWGEVSMSGFSWVPMEWTAFRCGQVEIAIGPDWGKQERGEGGNLKL